LTAGSTCASGTSPFLQRNRHSVVARSAGDESWGVAVASRVLAVGRAVPGAEARVGAVATQAFCNLTFRPRSLEMMRDGQGNILAGPEVVEAMEVARHESAQSEALEWRLMATLMAGDRTGGDRRGRQSAAILVVSPDGAYEALRGGGAGGPSDEAVLLRRVGYGPASPGAADVTASLERWAFDEELLDRLVPGSIDPGLLGFLRQCAGEPWAAAL